MAPESQPAVFLSFVHDDESWATRLFDELVDRGLTVFRAFSSAAGKDPEEALRESRVVVVLWSPAARESESVSHELELARGRILPLALGTPDGPRNTAPIHVIPPEVYDKGPDALPETQWRTIASTIERAVRQVSGQAAEFRLSPSVNDLSRRLPDPVSAWRVVGELLSTHTDYARGDATARELPAEPEGALHQTVDAWIAEVKGLFDGTRQPELHGRPLILGLGIAYRPLGRQLLDTGLFQTIEGKLHEQLDSILTESGHRARDALEPVPLAGYVADNLLGEDMLGLRAEVAALCAVISAEAVHPPLSVGLFGPWGSGKSFFMRLMRKEIDRIQARARQARKDGREDPFCEEIVQIDFNAWHYLDANLWASLMARIWEQLAAHGDGTADAPDSRHRELLKRLETSTALRREAERGVDEAQKRATDAQSKLDELSRQREAASDALAALSARDVAGEVASDPDVRTAIAAVEHEAGLPAGSLSLSDLRGLAADLRGLGRLRAVWRLLKGRKAWRRVILVLAVVALAIGVALVVASDWAAGVAATLGAVIAAVAAAGRALSTVIKPAAALTTAVDSALTRAREEQSAREAEIMNAEREQRAQLLSLQEETAARRATLIAADERERDARQGIAEIEAGRAAPRFIQERAASADYERHLGLISMIQRDLATLSDLMAPPDADGMPATRDEELPQIDRIVLYIDDLDRCPAHLVIEVLQAVHLLLAYPLFVVVVGVDPRWLVSSLTRHHRAMLGSEAAIVADDLQHPDDMDWTAKRPQEYLEKIFQLPLILRPMEEAGYARLVSQLLPPPAVQSNGDQPPPEQANGQDGGTTVAGGSDAGEDFDPGHRSLQIEQVELDLVQQLWPLMPSPRAVKRLVNVYRFLRAQVTPHELPAFTGESKPPGDYPAVLFLLAVLVGLPDDVPTVLSVICDRRKTWKEVLADTSGVPQATLDKLRPATEGFDDYPLEKVREQVPRVVRFSFSFW